MIRAVKEGRELAGSLNNLLKTESVIFGKINPITEVRTTTVRAAAVDKPAAFSEKIAVAEQHSHSTIPTLLCSKYTTEFNDISHAQPKIMAKSGAEMNQKIFICHLLF
ncbi:MAG: hypothetical protein AAB627_00755 [Patescibacteria group bacterium]